MTQIREGGVEIPADQRVIIWSGEHQAYWRPNAQGYVTVALAAGVYSRAEAERLTTHCGPEKDIQIKPVPADFSPVAAYTPTPSPEIAEQPMGEALVVFADDMVECRLPELGQGYFCTPDALLPIADAVARSSTPTDPFTTARNDIAGLPDHGMSADVQVAEQRVGEWITREAALQACRDARTHAEKVYGVAEGVGADIAMRRMQSLATPKPADPTSVAGGQVRATWQRVSDALDGIEGGMHAELEDAASAMWTLLATNAPDAAKREGL